MKTLKEHEKKVEIIKKNNYYLKDRIPALEKAGYLFEWLRGHTQFKADRKYFPAACSRDWNRTYGYCSIEKTKIKGEIK